MFMTVNAFEIYYLKEQSTPLKVASLIHDLENVEEEYLTVFITQQYICYLTTDVLYFFKLSDDKEKVLFREEYPSSYFGVKQFTKIFTINLWRGVAFIKTGFRTVHFFDFTPIRKPIAIKLNLDLLGKDDIDQLKTFGHNLAVAIRYQDGTMDIYDLSKQEIIKSYTFLNVIYSNYDLQSNQYIILQNNSIANIIDCNTYKINKEMNIQITPDFFKIYRTGTQIIASILKKQIYFYDMKTYSLVMNMNAPPQYDFQSLLVLTNLLMTSKINQSIIEFALHEVETDNPQFCHESCNQSCKKPFVPCKKFSIAFLSIIFSLLIVGVIFAMFSYLVKAIEVRAAEKDKMSQFQLSELKKSMISKNPMGASIIIKERRLTREKKSRSNSSTGIRKNSRCFDE